MAYLTQRTMTPERMDDPDVDRSELAHGLAFIRLVNRRLGGSAAAIRHIDRWTRHWPTGKTIRILDVGTGSADIPVAIAEWAASQRRQVEITAVDLHEKTLAEAQRFAGSRSNIRLVCADALKLTDQFTLGDFDFAHAGMFLHHLRDIEIATVLRMMDRLAAHGIIWNDLVRGMIGRVGIRLLTVGAPDMVQHDARVSVEAGFTRSEALELASRVGLQNVRYRTHLGYRFTLTARHEQE